MTVDVEINGMDAIQDKISRLGNPRFTRNAATRAARKAMRIVRDAARQNAKAIDNPETREKIWKNITIAAGKPKDKKTVLMRVGVKGGASVNGRSNRPALAALPGGDTTDWRFPEYGTEHQAATPFMRPALATNIQRVTDDFTKNFNEELDKELAKQ